MPDAQLKCDIPADLIRFDRPLFYLAKQLKATRPIKIVAIGSSSTAGEAQFRHIRAGCKRRCGFGIPDMKSM